MLFNILISIIGFLLILSPIVFIHELGHFFFARRFGVKVEVFSVGFGPKLFSIKDKYETIWQISSIPIGGYVKMLGELNVTSDLSKDKVLGSFHSANVWQRVFIVAGGPLANVILTIFLLFIINFSYGKYEVSNEIGDIVPNSVADISGLKIGDKIININSTKIEKFDQLRQFIIESPDKEISLTILRDGSEKQFLVKPRAVWSEDFGLNIGQLGIISNQGKIIKFGFSQSLYNGFYDTYLLTKAMLRGIIRIISGNSQSGEIGGPIKIAELSGKALITGWLAILYFCALISLNLGLINLLPIPALDGGHLLLYIIEIISGKPLPERIQFFLLRLGISFLISLMIIITFFDISRYI